MSKSQEETYIDINCMCYMESYKLLIYKHNEIEDTETGLSSFLFPAITLLPFAIELALKSRIQQQRLQKNQDDVIPNIHNLWLLFSKLDGKIQNEIIFDTIHLCKIYNDKTGDDEVIDKTIFLEKLKLNSHRFEESRYVHENLSDTEYDVMFMEAILFSLVSDEEEYKYHLKKIFSN